MAIDGGPVSSVQSNHSTRPSRDDGKKEDPDKIPTEQHGHVMSCLERT